MELREARRGGRRPLLVYVSREKRRATYSSPLQGRRAQRSAPGVELGEQRAVRAGAGLRHELQQPELRPGGHAHPSPTTTTRPSCSSHRCSTTSAPTTSTPMSLDPSSRDSTPTNLNDVLVQNKRWMSGLLAAGVSMHCPLTSRTALSTSVLQTMSFPFPVLCYATVQPLCFLRGVPIFPKVVVTAGSSPWFWVFAAVFGVVSTAAPDGGGGGEAEAGAEDVVERAEVLDARRRHRTALRLHQRVPQPDRRRIRGLRARRSSTRTASSTSRGAPRCCSRQPRSPCSTPRH